MQLTKSVSSVAWATASIKSRKQSKNLNKTTLSQIKSDASTYFFLKQHKKTFARRQAFALIDCQRHRTIKTKQRRPAPALLTGGEQLAQIRVPRMQCRSQTNNAAIGFGNPFEGKARAFRDAVCTVHGRNSTTVYQCHEHVITT